MLILFPITAHDLVNKETKMLFTQSDDFIQFNNG